MVGGSKVVKLTAKTALSGNWLKVIFATVIFLICCFVCGFSADIFSYTDIFSVSAAISALFYLFLIFPLFLGILRYTWRMIFGVCDNPIAVFYYLSDLKKYKRALGFVFRFILKMLPPILILYTPVTIFWLFTQSYIYDFLGISMPLWVANTNSLFIILGVFISVGIAFYMLKFYLSPFLFVADDEIEAGEALHMSSIIARKSALDFIYLLLSLSGFIIISLPVIPLAFTMPYIITCYAVHVRFAVAEYNMHIKNPAEVKQFNYE